MKVHMPTDFFGRECSDLGVDGWVSCNLNIVRIRKSVRNIGRSLIPVKTANSSYIFGIGGILLYFHISGVCSDISISYISAANFL